MQNKLEKIQKTLGYGSKYLQRFVVTQIIPDSLNDDDCMINCELSLSEKRICDSYINMIFTEVKNIEFRGGPYQTIRIIGMQINLMRCGSEFKVRVTSEDDETYIIFYCKNVDIVS